MSYRLILFDVDGTLLLSGPAIREIFGGAFRKACGSEPVLDGNDFVGQDVHPLATGHEKIAAAVLGAFPQEVLNAAPECLDGLSQAVDLLLHN